MNTEQRNANAATRDSAGTGADARDTSKGAHDGEAGKDSEDDATNSVAEDDESGPLEWFVVHTFSGYENTVKRNLESSIKSSGFEHWFGEILVPSEQVTERRGKTTRKTTKKFFPGYIFVNMVMTKETWHMIKNTPKVTGFLGGNTPRPVREAEMNRMLGRSTEKREEKVPEVTYVVGDQVRVKSGAFANFTGDVEEVNQDKHKIWLSVSIFGRPTRVEVDFSEVEPAVA